MRLALVAMAGLVWGLLAGMADERRRWTAARAAFLASHRRGVLTYDSGMGSQTMTAWMPNDAYQRSVITQRIPTTFGRTAAEALYTSGFVRVIDDD